MGIFFYANEIKRLIEKIISDRCFTVGLYIQMSRQLPLSNTFTGTIMDELHCYGKYNYIVHENSC